ncbi:hypothetical protein KY285_010620 [Solanum tuberosum]|nr:hypothetical protein KY289_011162 [Solanum tuberosum]KAH0734910.1 hypothetical protein KY285_010617 [Solanum tuberosum]KAH0734913.1 hypothetical protein KY285_010620 [Solanum tuberosum]
MITLFFLSNIDQPPLLSTPPGDGEFPTRTRVRPLLLSSSPLFLSPLLPRSVSFSPGSSNTGSSTSTRRSSQQLQQAAAWRTAPTSEPPAEASSQLEPGSATHSLFRPAAALASQLWRPCSLLASLFFFFFFLRQAAAARAPNSSNFEQQLAAPIKQAPAKSNGSLDGSQQIRHWYF